MHGYTYKFMGTFLQKFCIYNLSVQKGGIPDLPYTCYQQETNLILTCLSISTVLIAVAMIIMHVHMQIILEGKL